MALQRGPSSYIEHEQHSDTHRGGCSPCALLAKQAPIVAALADSEAVRRRGPSRTWKATMGHWASFPGHCTAQRSTSTRATLARYSTTTFRGLISHHDADATPTSMTTNRGETRSGHRTDAAATYAAVGVFLLLHADGPERLADALDRRTYGAHHLPRDLFELVGLAPVLREPKPVTSIARQKAPAVAPINVNLELTRIGHRNIALFDSVRTWAYVQMRPRSIAAWSETVGEYASEQNRRFPAPLLPDEVGMLSWNVASWTWCGGGPLDHGYEAQSRRGRASAAVRRFKAYDRDVAIKARLAAGDRQIDIARAFGVSQNTVSTARARLERRRRAPREYRRT